MAFMVLPVTIFIFVMSMQCMEIFFLKACHLGDIAGFWFHLTFSDDKLVMAFSLK